MLSFNSNVRAAGAFVATQWKANNQPVDDAGNYVSIRGRGVGIVAWLLTLLRLAPQYELSISGERMEIKSTDIFGSHHILVPLENICSTSYGYKKPFWQALALFVVITPIISTILANPLNMNGGGYVLGALLSLVLAVLYYYLNKMITLEFVQMGGWSNTVAFKGSAIEGLIVDEKRAAYVMQLTQSLIDARVTARAIINPPTN